MEKNKRTRELELEVEGKLSAAFERIKSRNLVKCSSFEKLREDLKCTPDQLKQAEKEGQAALNKSVIDWFSFLVSTIEHLCAKYDKLKAETKVFQEAEQKMDMRDMSDQRIANLEQDQTRTEERLTTQEGKTKKAMKSLLISQWKDCSRSIVIDGIQQDVKDGKLEKETNLETKLKIEREVLPALELNGDVIIDSAQRFKNQCGQTRENCCTIHDHRHEKYGNVQLKELERKGFLQEMAICQ